MEDENYFESEEFLEVLKTYEDSKEAGNTVYMDPDDLADIADYYRQRGMMDEAHDAIELAMAFNADSVGPLLYKAREAIHNGDYAVAESYAQRLTSLDAVEAHFMKGEILLSQGKEDEAEMLFHDYYETLAPDEITEYVYDVATLYSDFKCFDRALEWIARGTGDNSSEFKELMGHTLFGVGKYAESAKVFNELIDRDPFSKRYWTMLANAQFMDEDYSSSVASSEYAIAIDPDDPESILAKANGLFRLGNSEEAYEYFKRYSELEPDDEFGLLHQGTCLLTMGKVKEAIKLLKKAEKLCKDDSPYLPDIYQELAFAYSEDQQASKALKYLDKTKDLDCDHTAMEVVRGHILLTQNKIDEAELVFRDAINKSKSPAHTMLRIIVSLYDSHYIEHTYELFKTFFKYVNDEWTDGYSYMALCCRDAGHYKEFMYYLKKATEKNPKEAKFVLGHLFPEEMEPDQYYEYIMSKIQEK